MLRNADITDLLAIVPYLREIDRHEALALRWDDDLESWAEDVFERTPENLTYCATLDGAPVYVWGYVPIHPGAWSTWGVGTDLWPAVWRPVSRFIKGSVLRTLREERARLLQCLVIDEKVPTVDLWMTRWFGAQIVAHLPDYGREGESFTLYQWRP